MSDQVLLKKPYAESREVALHLCLDKALRVYRDSPYGITIQVRTHTAKKGRISSVSVSKAEAVEIARYLLAKAEELSVAPGAKAAA